MSFLFVDFEATCWKNQNLLSREQEIIEIGAVLVDRYGEIISEYQSFVKPTVHAELSYYCINLTQIEQKTIDRSKTFTTIYEDFCDWWLDHGGAQKWMSWGSFDYRILQNDCKQNKVDFSIMPAYTDLKKFYQEINQLSKPVGLLKALKNEQIEFVGRIHSAIDDARNLKTLALRYIDLLTI